MTRSSSHLLAALLAITAATASAATQPLPEAFRAVGQRPVTAPPPALAGLNVFHSGPVRRRVTATAPVLNILNGDIGSGLVGLLPGGTQSKFQLTPQQPFVSGKGHLDLNGPAWCSALETGNGCPATGMLFFNPDPLTSDVNVIIEATAGQTYLIDESVHASSPASGCQLIVYGPDGQQSSFPCKGGGKAQHIVFAYAATQTGEAWFSTTVQGAAGGLFYGAAIAPAQ